MIHEIQEIAFAKMHGLGNDFVIIDAKLLTTSCDLKHLTLKIADRHLGIGCDQFITYEKHSDYYKVQVYNQDGSTAKACGNAMRCLSKLIYNNLGEQNINIRVKIDVLPLPI